MAKRLNWEKEAKRLKVIREGSKPLWEDLPFLTGSPAQNRLIRKRLRKPRRKQKQTPTTQMPTRKVVRAGKVKVLRRRKGEGVMQLEKSIKR